VIKSVLLGLLDLLAPASCSACEQPVETRDDAFCLACAACLERVHTIADPDLRAVYSYGGPVADAVWRLKYEGRSEIARSFRGPLCEQVAPWIAQIDAVTAIPLANAKLRMRGYNQSALLGQVVARALGLPFRPRWLVRRRSGTRQVGQNREVRLLQLRGMFECRARLDHKTVLVVDDVRTTGATLREAARALEEQGARRVLKLVLAQADDKR
jgi:ComF family protein